MKTIETLRSEYMRVNSWNIPLLSQGPIDAVNVLREANVDVVIQGDNRGVPNVQLEVQDVQTQRPRVEQDLTDAIRNQHISSMSIPPSVLDETQESTFASTTLRAHALFNKRVLTNQTIINSDLLYDHVTKYTLNSGELIKRLALAIKDRRDLLTDKQRALGNAMPIIEEFLEVLSVTLPLPDSGSVEEKKTDLDNQKQLIDNVIDARYPDSVLEYILPEDIRDRGRVIKDLLKSVAIGRYVAEQGYLPYLERLIDEENVDDTIVAEILSALKPLSRLSVESILAFDQIRKKNANGALKGALPEDASTDSSFGDSTSDSSSDSSDDGGFGDDSVS